MGRLSDTLLGKVAYGAGVETPMVDVSTIGQNGHGQNPQHWVSMTQYVRKPLIIRVLEYPRGFDDLPTPAKWKQTLKSLLETQALRVEGYNGQLNLEFQSTPFGGAGEEIETFSKTTRARSQPSWTWRERYGRSIGRFWDQIIYELFGHPETNYPNVCTRTNAPTDLLLDYQCFAVIAFEPDPTFRFINKAWVTVAMAPRQGSVVEGMRDLTAPGDGLDITIEFTGVSFQNAAVDALAQVFLREMKITGADPNTRQMFIQKIDPSLTPVSGGYADNLAEMARSTIAG